MKNPFGSTKILIKQQSEKRKHTPQVAIYRYKVEEGVRDSGIESERSRL